VNKGVPLPRKVTGLTSDKNKVSLKKRIKEAEKQLNMIPDIIDLDPSLAGPSNSQTSESYLAQRANKRKAMVIPGSRDAPKFSSKRPQELRRFIRTMSDLWQEAGIENDQEKKLSVGKYADAESEEEWAALESFKEEYSWTEFLAELISNYPEAAAAARGTPARIREICREAGGILMGDLPALYAFRRAFLTEANKLRVKPAVMSNRELVELFISGLSGPLVQALLQHLGGVHRNTGKHKEEEDPEDIRHRPEDRYKLEDVCEAAIRVSENAQGLLHLFNNNETARRVTTMVQSSEDKSGTSGKDLLEETRAKEMDRLTIENKQLFSKVKEMDEMLKSLLAPKQERPATTLIQSSATLNETNGQLGVTQRWVKSAQPEGCFGCGEKDHFQNKCEKVKQQIQIGNLILDAEGRIKLPDGSRVPKFPQGACLIERMERYYATNKPAPAYYGAFEEAEDRALSTLIKPRFPSMTSFDEREQRIARQERELDLRERESLIKAKQLKLEKSESKSEKPYTNPKAAYLLELLEGLTEDDLATVKDAKSGFV